MTLLAKILVGLVAAFFLVWGLRLYFMPDAMAVEFAIVPSGLAGVSTLRGDLGGMFVAVGTFAALGLWRSASHWLYAAASIVGAVAFGRVIGFAFDGAPMPAVVAFVAEIVFIAILLFGAARLRTGDQP